MELCVVEVIKLESLRLNEWASFELWERVPFASRTKMSVGWFIAVLTASIKPVLVLVLLRELTTVTVISRVI